LPLQEAVDGDTEEQGGDTCGGRSSFGEKAEDESRKNSGGDVALKFLDVIEDALEFRVAQFRCNEAYNNDKQDGDDTSHFYDCLL